MDIPLLATLKKITNRNSQWHGDDTQPAGNVSLCLAKKARGMGDGAIQSVDSVLGAGDDSLTWAEAVSVSAPPTAAAAPTSPALPAGLVVRFRRPPPRFDDVLRRK